MAVWPMLMLTCSSHPTSIVHASVVSYGYILYFVKISLIELIIINFVFNSYQRLFHQQSHLCSKHNVSLRCVIPDISACFYLGLSRILSCIYLTGPQDETSNVYLFVMDRGQRD